MAIGQGMCTILLVIESGAAASGVQVTVRLWEHQTLNLDNMLKQLEGFVVNAQDDLRITDSAHDLLKLGATNSIDYGSFTEFESLIGMAKNNPRISNSSLKIFEDVYHESAVDELRGVLQDSLQDISYRLSLCQFKYSHRGDQSRMYLLGFYNDDFRALYDTPSLNESTSEILLSSSVTSLTQSRSSDMDSKKKPFHLPSVFYVCLETVAHLTSFNVAANMYQKLHEKLLETLLFLDMKYQRQDLLSKFSISTPLQHASRVMTGYIRNHFSKGVVDFSLSDRPVQFHQMTVSPLPLQFEINDTARKKEVLESYVGEILSFVKSFLLGRGFEEAPILRNAAPNATFFVVEKPSDGDPRYYVIPKANDVVQLYCDTSYDYISLASFRIVTDCLSNEPPRINLPQVLARTTFTVDLQKRFDTHYPFQQVSLISMYRC
jgi:hypothetical protein